MDDNLDQLAKSLGLRRIREILANELEQATTHGKSYSELLSRLFRAEHNYKQERSMYHRIKRAKLPEQWSLETFPFDLQQNVRKSTIMELAELDFIAGSQNVVFIGGTGVGKTGLATGLLYKALQNGYRGLFIKAQDLFDELYTTLADRSTASYIRRLMRIDLLVVDEMGYLNLRPEQTNIFFKLMEERYNRKATIITTNLEYDDWYDFLGNKHMVSALLDRLRHHCHTIRIDGPSIRFATG